MTKMRASSGYRPTTVILLTLAATCGLLALGCARDRPSVRTYPMGERAEAGSIVYSVIEARWSTRLGEGAAARMPDNRFMLLRLSVTNGGTKEISVPSATLVADGGQTYSELTDGAGVEDWLGVLRKLKPAETVHGWILFDAPRADYHLRVTDDAFDPADARIALIQVPVRLESGPEYLPPAESTR
jgi:hypothetical protein